MWEGGGKEGGEVQVEGMEWRGQHVHICCSARLCR